MSGHVTSRITHGPWEHAYICSCGWASDVSANGEPGAGAALVRHMVAVSGGVL